MDRAQGHLLRGLLRGTLPGEDILFREAWAGIMVPGGPKEEEEMKLTITHGSKEIHGAKVLKDVNMTLESGAVYGFWGKNGSGKTMLMRAVCGLIRLTEGEIKIDGITIGKEQDFPPELGMLLETPTFLPDWTGYDNLRLLANLRGKAGPEEVAAALEQVGLDPIRGR